jgi:type III secretion protein D
MRLEMRPYVVGDGDEADIVLSDWSGPAVRLTPRDEGTGYAPADSAEHRDGDTVDDLVPRRFGDVVLCVGPVEADWPSDIALLEALMAPAPPARADTAALPRRWWRWRDAGRERRLVFGGAMLSALLLCLFIAVIGHGHSAAAPPEPLRSRVVRAVQATGVLGLSIRTASDGKVYVDGMVADGSEASRVRAALAPLLHEGVVLRHASASDVAQSISDALANPGLAVRYRGDGEFRVSGATVGLDAVRRKLERIAADLGPAVTRIELAATDLPPPPILPTNALMSAGDVQYVQTRDGTKHLVIQSPADDAPSEPR